MVSLDQGWKPEEESLVEERRASSLLAKRLKTNLAVQRIAAISKPQPTAPPPKTLLRSEIHKLARKEFQDALAELEKKREKTAERVIKEAKKRADEKGGGPLPPFRCSVDYVSSYCASFKSYAKQLANQYNNLLYVPRVEVSYCDPVYQLRGYSGDEVLRSLRNVFSRFPAPPTPFQWKIFEAMCCCAKAIIYGSEYFSDPAWVMSRNNWQEDNDLCCILTGRKTGKSSGLAMCHLAFMMVMSNTVSNEKKESFFGMFQVIRGFRGVNASRTLEQSIIIIDLASQLLRLHPDMKLLGLKKGQTRARYTSIVHQDQSESSLEGMFKSSIYSVCLLSSSEDEIRAHGQIFGRYTRENLHKAWPSWRQCMRGNMRQRYLDHIHSGCLFYRYKNESLAQNHNTYTRKQLAEW